MTKIYELIKNGSEHYELKKKSESIDELYGVNVIEIKLSDLEELRKGRCLCFDDMEYATVVYVGENE